MEREIYFQNIKGIGNLYLDHIFFEFEMEPLLFTCVDSAHTLYFCHCYKMLYELKWFIVPISVDKLSKLIDGTSDIRQTILSAKKILNITRDIKGNDTNVWKKPCEIPREDLPMFGICLKCDKKDARMYLDNKTSDDSKNLSIAIEYVIDNDWVNDISAFVNMNFEIREVLVNDGDSTYSACKEIIYKHEQADSDSYIAKKLLYKDIQEKDVYADMSLNDAYAA